jgi:hypothetical protein
LARPKTAGAKPAPARGLIRQLHIWISVFVAPSLLFFALTGALQTFRIPDQKEAPVVLQKLARLHKDDVFAIKPPRPKKAEVARDGGDGKHARPDKPPEAKPQPARSTEVLKWFFAAASLGIAATTLFGVWMALAYSRRKALIWVLLLAGARFETDRPCTES